MTKIVNRELPDEGVDVLPKWSIGEPYIVKGKSLGVDIVYNFPDGTSDEETYYWTVLKDPAEIERFIDKDWMRKWEHRQKMDEVMATASESAKPGEEPEHPSIKALRGLKHYRVTGFSEEGKGVVNLGKGSPHTL